MMGRPIRQGGDVVDQVETYRQLIAFLDRYGVQYRLIDHAPEGH